MSEDEEKKTSVQALTQAFKQVSVEEDEDTQISSVYVENELYSLKDKPYPRLGCVMMVKNEEKRIKVSLESVKDTVCCYIIFDTGSTDTTKDIIVNYCKDVGKNLYMINGNFIDFSTSRNTLIDYAEKFDIDYLLLLDTNDELREGDLLLKELKNEEIKKSADAFLLHHQWWSGEVQDYYNCRLFKPKSNWRYKGVVHELLQREKSGETEFPYVKLSHEIVLYQDRTMDDNKSFNRFNKDKKLLYREYRKDKKNPRTLYYLAQTYGCLKKYQNAFKMYTKRYDVVDGYIEERFLAALRCGDYSIVLGFGEEKIVSWYLKAYGVCDRVEPLVKLSKYYRTKKKWNMSYMFAVQACILPDPVEFTFVVDNVAYEHGRFNELGIVAYYYGKYEIGKNAALKAIQDNKDKKHINTEIDRGNLKFYLDREQQQGRKITKQEYFTLRNKSLRSKGSLLSTKQINKTIKSEWQQKKLVLN